MHNGTVGADRAADDVVRVLEVDDDRLGGSVGLIILLAHADVLVGLECLQPLSALLDPADPMDLGHLRSFAMILKPAASLVS